jgi:hypothetical protein
VSQFYGNDNMTCPKELLLKEPHHGVFVPDLIARCPECGGTLVVQAHGWDEATGLPLADALDIDCIDDPLNCDDTEPYLWHKHRQSDWQPIVDDIRKWTEAIVG